MKLRNLIIYIVGVYSLSITGAVIANGGNNIGELVFIISPILMAVIIRSFFKEGWKTAGLKLNIRGNGKWYLISIFVFPLIIGGVGLIGWMTGILEVNNLNSKTVTSMLMGAIPVLIFCIFEEFGWRGYLEAELAKSKIKDFHRHIVVGLVWGLWHIPYYLVTDLIPVSKSYHIPAMIIFCILSSTLYGQIRKKTDSVWPAVLTHTIGNTLLLPIINNNVFTSKNSMLFDVQAYSVVTMLIWAVITWAFVRKLKKS